jgi:crotonobetainyl-CoA:carnitine CoA-transferase CaiB-like acyl-CoA transferase
MILADLGADIVKVERPGEGDDTRHWGPPFAGTDAAYFLSLNRNKRSIAIDLGVERGASLVRRLAGRSDVLIENFRPGLMQRFGLDLEGLRAANPRLVTCSLTAFGGAEPGTAERPGYDIIVQALSGLMSITGPRDGEPVKAGVALLDVITGLYAAIGILAAVRERDATGNARHVEVALFDASVAAMVNQAANYLIGGDVPVPMGNEHPNIVPYQVFRASDRPFVLAAGNDRLFARTCDVLERPEWALDPRFTTNAERVQHRDELIALLQAELVRRPAGAWIERLDAAGVPCAPILAMDEVFASAAGSALVQEIVDPVRGPLRLVANPIRIDGSLMPTRTPPPRLDEQGDQIRGGAGGR